MRAHIRRSSLPLYCAQLSIRSPEYVTPTLAGFYASEATAPSKQDAKAVLLRALELGIDFYNTSNLYGPYVNEELIGAPWVWCHSMVVWSMGPRLPVLASHDHVWIVRAHLSVS